MEAIMVDISRMSAGVTQASSHARQVGNEEWWTPERRLFLEETIRGAAETADGIKQTPVIVPAM